MNLRAGSLTSLATKLQLLRAGRRSDRPESEDSIAWNRWKRRILPTGTRWLGQREANGVTLTGSEAHTGDSFKPQNPLDSRFR
jgi:hypothetical protein